MPQHHSCLLGHIPGMQKQMFAQTEEELGSAIRVQLVASMEAAAKEEKENAINKSTTAATRVYQLFVS